MRLLGRTLQQSYTIDVSPSSLTGRRSRDLETAVRARTWRTATYEHSDPDAMRRWLRDIPARITSSARVKAPRPATLRVRAGHRMTGSAGSLCQCATRTRLRTRSSAQTPAAMTAAERSSSSISGSPAS